MAQHGQTTPAAAKHVDGWKLTCFRRPGHPRHNTIHARALRIHERTLQRVNRLHADCHKTCIHTYLASCRFATWVRRSGCVRKEIENGHERVAGRKGAARPEPAFLLRRTVDGKSRLTAPPLAPRAPARGDRGWHPWLAFLGEWGLREGRRFARIAARVRKALPWGPNRAMIRLGFPD